MRRMAIALGMAFMAQNAVAQNSARINGRVVNKASRATVAGAEVDLAPGARRLVSDSSGHFRFDEVPVGNVTLVVKRIGFVPESLFVTLGDKEDLDVSVELTPSAQQLDTVNVAARATPIPTGKLAGFYERKNVGHGRFIEAKDLEQQLHRRLADILTSRIAGTRQVRSTRGGTAAFFATTRSTPNALVGGPGAFSGGARLPPPCYASVYVDGTVVFTSGQERMSGRAEDVLFDINSIDPAHISAIEFYTSAQTPAQYNRTGSSCGVLLIWTK
ncbi:MAG: carboxypeptidase-like regulatory domain-containing protein [Gemmatimonadaceae bacterium]